MKILWSALLNRATITRMWANAQRVGRPTEYSTERWYSFYRPTSQTASCHENSNRSNLLSMQRRRWNFCATIMARHSILGSYFL